MVEKAFEGKNVKFLIRILGIRNLILEKIPKSRFGFIFDLRSFILNATHSKTGGFAMKKLFFLIVFLAGLMSIVQSQTSIGFKNPQNLESLLSYRLPTWGYSTFIISSSGKIANTVGKYTNDETRKGFLSQLYFNPIFIAYNESDNSIKSVSARLESNFQYHQYKTDPPSSEDRKNRMFNSSLDLFGKLNHYYYKDAFLSGELGVSSRYEDATTKSLTSSNIYKEIRRSNQLALRIGTGVGRVRDVTPMIRALRFQERYAAIQKISPFNDTQIQFLAHEIAKRSGYERVYDRSDKFFWDNLFEGIGVESRLTPYEIYFLSDIFQENVGIRLEGWNISAGVTWNYSNDEYYRSAGGFGQMRWYKNLNLNHQIGVNILGSLSNYFSEKALFEYLGGVDLKLSYLWVITDRVLWQTNYASEFDFTKYSEKRGQRPSYKKENFKHSLNSEISYYIEDNLSFFIRTNILLNRFDRDFYSVYQDYNLDFSFGVAYYIDRNMK